jgi:endo-1,4-beta-xylanase
MSSLLAAAPAAAARIQHVRLWVALEHASPLTVRVQAPCAPVRVTAQLGRHRLTARRLTRGEAVDVPVPGVARRGWSTVVVVARATGRVRCRTLVRVAQPVSRRPGAAPTPAAGEPVPATEVPAPGPGPSSPSPRPSPEPAAPSPSPTPTPTATPPPPPPVCQPSPTTIGSGRTIALGAAVSTQLLDDPDYVTAFTERFDTLTPENELKMDTLHPAADRWNWAPGDRLMALAGDAGKFVRGHTLVFYSQIPGWVTSRSWTRDQLRAYLRGYIDTVVGRYAGCVSDWDVVNEALNDDGSRRQSLWQQDIGDDYIADAFRWAHEADPAAQLFLNDYYTEYPGPKADAQYALVQQLLAGDVPIDGVGLELHADTAGHAPTESQIAVQMQRYADLGLDVEITEMDVSEQYASGDTATKDQAAADIYGRAATACATQPRCTRFGVWGVTDASSWLGAQYRPLLLDSDYAPKPAWSVVDAVLR